MKTRLRVRLAAALCGLVVAGCDDPPGERARRAEAKGDWTAAAAAWAELAAAGPAPAPAVLLGLGRAQAQLAHPDAETTLSTALAAADAAGDRALAADVRQALARLVLGQGRAEAALAHVDRALADAPPPEAARALRMTRAAAVWRLGDFEGAEATWRAVRAEADAAADASLAVRAAEGLAGAARFAGRFAEAATLCETVEQAAAVQTNLTERARSLANCGAIRGVAGAFARGETLTTDAVAAADASGAARARVHARNALASVHIEADDAARAHPVADEAVRLARDAGLPDLLGDALLYRALAEARLARHDAAERSLDALAALALPASATTAEAHALRGRLALAAGRADAAIAAFERAVDALETLRAAVTPRQLQDFFDVDRRAAYLGLVDLLSRRLGPGDAERALAVAGRLESRAFLEGLRARGGPLPREAPADEGFAARGTRVAPAAAVAAVGDGTGGASLPAEIAALVLVPLVDATLVAWVTRQGVSLHRAPLTGAEATQAARTLAARLAAHEEAEPGASRLARTLFGPVEARLRAHPEGRPLAIIAHGGLRGLPAEVLPFDGRPLARRHPVFGAPSLPALALLLARRPPAEAESRPALIVADATGDLPGARAAAPGLGARFRAANVLVGPTARETDVRAALPGADPIHFAVHGYAPTPDHPAWLALGADEAHDGRLTAAEVAASSLDAPLVVLSACETSAAPAHATGEAPGVLDRAFLHAGARAVISTRWPVNDQIARQFDEAFFDALPTLGPLGAFHAARERLAAGGPPRLAAGDAARHRGLRPPGAAPTPPPDPRRPGHWAAFVFVGRPG